ncbi:MAG TPA: SDR family NAD(P)-dependent oxidoreductase [Bacteroidales bacterium]|nr:SDR family NAD(P)-dependent oxidoreductase [Bacteroidales bacterium]
MNKITLITGATSGIGRSCAYLFAQNNHDLILIGRRKNRLDEISGELKSNYNIQVLQLTLDVRDNEAVKKAISTLPDEWKLIEILINNAGLAVGLNTLQDGDVDDWERMIDTNIKGLLYMSRALLPMFVQQNRGHVINIDSIAGKEVYTNGNVYCASKHAVDALTKSMRDLVKHGVKVTQVAPGAIETEFSLVRFKGDKDQADNIYKGFKPLSPDDIANVVYYTTTLPAHVNINDIVIMPTAQASATVFNKD